MAYHFPIFFSNSFNNKGVLLKKNKHKTFYNIAIHTIKLTDQAYCFDQKCKAMKHEIKVVFRKI